MRIHCGDELRLPKIILKDDLESPPELMAAAPRGRTFNITKDILTLDEPANGLDPEGVRWLRELVRGLAEGGHTVLISIHILAEVAQTVDSVVIIDKGRLVAQSSLEELTAGLGRRVVRVRTPRAHELGEALGGDGVAVTYTAADRLEITGSTPERVGMLAAERGIPILESTTEVANLEDVFFQLTDEPHPQEVAR